MRVRFVFAAVGLVAAATSHAQELVVNGGFETGDLTGWTLGGDASAFIVDGPAHSGVDSVKMTPGSSTNTLSEVLGTTAGQSYTYSLWFDHEGGDSTSNLVAIDWNGTAVSGSPTFLPVVTGWVNYSYTVMATGASSTIAITAHDPVGNIYLDDVSVQPTSAPEPATYAALGLGVLALVRRRRK